MADGAILTIVISALVCLATIVDRIFTHIERMEDMAINWASEQEEEEADDSSEECGQARDPGQGDSP